MAWLLVTLSSNAVRSASSEAARYSERGRIDVDFVAREDGEPSQSTQSTMCDASPPVVNDSGAGAIRTARPVSARAAGRVVRVSWWYSGQRCQCHFSPPSDGSSVASVS